MVATHHERGEAPLLGSTGDLVARLLGGDWPARLSLAVATPRLLEHDVVSALEAQGHVDVAGFLARLGEIGADATEPELGLLVELEQTRADVGLVRPKRLVARLSDVVDQVEAHQAVWALPSVYETAVEVSGSVEGPRRLIDRLANLTLEVLAVMVGASRDALEALLGLDEDPSDGDWSHLVGLIDAEQAQLLGQVLVMFGELAFLDDDRIAYLEDRVELGLAIAARGDAARSEFELVVTARAVAAGRVDPPSMRTEACVAVAQQCLEAARADVSWLIRPGIAAALAAVDGSSDDPAAAAVAANLMVAGVRERSLAQSAVIEAVELFRTVLRMSGERSAEWADVAEDLSDALVVAVGWDQLEVSALAEAVDLAEEALASTEPDSEDHSRRTVFLAYQRLEAAAHGLLPVEVVTDSEQQMRDFVDARADEEDLSVDYNFGLWLSKAVRIGALPADRWIEAIEHLRRARELAAGHGIPELRYEHQFAVALLDASLSDALTREAAEAARLEAAQAFETALAHSKPDDPDFLGFLNDFANFAHLRILDGTHLDALTHVLEVFRRLVDTLGGGRDVTDEHPPSKTGAAPGPVLPGVSDRLASASDTLSGLLVEGIDAGILSPAATSEAVRLGRIAVARTPPDDARHASALANLAGKISTAVGWGHLAPEALNEAVRLSREAISVASPHDRNLPTYHLNLTGALYETYKHDRTRTDAAREAIAILGDVVASMPAHHPERPKYLTNLATMMDDLSTHAGDENQRATALRIHRAAVAAAVEGSAVHLKLLFNYGTALAHTVEDPEFNTTETVQELTRVVNEVWQRTRYGLAHPSRRWWAVNQSHEFLNLAPGKLVTQGYLEQAVTTIEAARGCLMSSMAAPTPPLGLPIPVAEVFGSAARDYDRVQDSVLAGVASVDDATAAGNRLVSAIGEVRELPDQSRFAHPPLPAEIAAGLDDGEVGVYVIPGPLGGTALCLYADAHVERIPLPLFDHDFVQRATDGLLDRRNDSQADSPTDVQTLCVSLWQVFARPLLKALADTHSRTLTLVPTGRAAMLPLHAAGVAGAAWLDQRFNVRFAPSLLRTNWAASEAASGRFAAVTDDPTLFFTAGDRLVVEHHFTGVDVDTPSRIEPVVDRLRDAHLSFVSGHARHALDGGAGLQLDDGFLTAEHLATLPRKRRLLALLNACSSGQIATTLPDENIGLHTALLAIGFRGVAGALWPMRDNVAFLSLARFAELVAEGAETSEALTEVRRWLRTATAGELRAWVLDLTHSIGLPPTLAERLNRSWAMFPDAAAPFADPADWAAFVYFGHDLPSSLYA